MNNVFKIEIARKGISKQLSILLQTVYIETYGVEGVSQEFAELILDQFTPEKIAEEIQSDQYDLFVATLNDNPVGVVLLEHQKKCPVGSLVATEISRLYILKRFYGKGIGQKLMETAEKAMLDQGKQKAWLWTLETNQRALKFYHEQGYAKIGEASLQLKENAYQNIVMYKDL